VRWLAVALPLLGGASAFAGSFESAAGADPTPTCNGTTCTETFTFTGGDQTWTVPAGVSSATFDAFAAQGGSGANGPGDAGLGGEAKATVSVVPGDIIEVVVGGRGGDGAVTSGGVGGFNGGAAGGDSFINDGGGGAGGGGGGASDVRTGSCATTTSCSLNDRIIVAGGGGGGSGLGLSFGGGGGHPAGGSGSQGSPLDGAGGSQTAGGSGGASGCLPTGTAGAAGSLGSGGQAGGGSVCSSGGGGGAGGYYGGGGGGSGSTVTGGGGGGGSSFGPTGASFQNAVHPGDGQVIITYAQATDLGVSIGASPNPVKTRNKLTYTITVKNFGAFDAQGVAVTDVLPSATQFVTASVSQGSCQTPAVGATGTVNCSLGSLGSGATATIQLVVKITAPGGSTLSNTASVSSATPDPNASNDSATVTTKVFGRR